MVALYRQIKILLYLKKITQMFFLSKKLVSKNNFPKISFQQNISV